jgi:hypothetical protein
VRLTRQAGGIGQRCDVFPDGLRRLCTQSRSFLQLCVQPATLHQKS